MKQIVCPVCQKSAVVDWKDETCWSCRQSAAPAVAQSVVQSRPTSPVGEVTVTENDFGGNAFERREIERGVDEAGNGWVRSRPVGEISRAVAHSDEIGDGQRTQFTRSEYPWSDWTPR